MPLQALDFSVMPLQALDISVMPLQALRLFSHAFAGLDFSVTSFLASRLFSHALSGRLLARVLQDGSSFLPESFQGGGIEFPILWPIA